MNQDWIDLLNEEITEATNAINTNNQTITTIDNNIVQMNNNITQMNNQKPTYRLKILI